MLELIASPEPGGLFGRRPLPASRVHRGSMSKNIGSPQALRRRRECVRIFKPVSFPDLRLCVHRAQHE